MEHKQLAQCEQERADLLAALRFLVDTCSPPPFFPNEGDAQYWFEKVGEAKLLLRRLDREALTGKRDGT